jgi:hypothetical protein
VTNSFFMLLFFYGFVTIKMKFMLLQCAVNLVIFIKCTFRYFFFAAVGSCGIFYWNFWNNVVAIRHFFGNFIVLFLAMCSSSLLITWLYHFILASLIFPSMSVTFVFAVSDPLDTFIFIPIKQKGMILPFC